MRNLLTAHNENNIEEMKANFEEMLTLTGNKASYDGYNDFDFAIRKNYGLPRIKAGYMVAFDRFVANMASNVEEAADYQINRNEAEIQVYAEMGIVAQVKWGNVEVVK